MLNKFYLTLGSLLLMGYSVVAFNGWEFGDPPREHIPPGERHAVHGYRGSSFWHSGYRGGK